MPVAEIIGRYKYFAMEFARKWKEREMMILLVLLFIQLILSYAYEWDRWHELEKIEHNNTTNNNNNRKKNVRNKLCCGENYMKRHNED